MKRMCTVLVACTLAAGLAACGESGALVGPEAPRHDSGISITAGSTIIGTDTTTVAPSSTETTTEETATERGTLGIGSGG